MVDIYVRGGFVITMDSNRRIISNGCVAISDGRIIAVGKCDELDRDYKGKAKVELKNSTLYPVLSAIHKGFKNNKEKLNTITEKARLPSTSLILSLLPVYQ